MILQYVALYIQIFPANQCLYRAQFQGSQSVLHAETIFASILKTLFNDLIDIVSFINCAMNLPEKFHQSNDQ